MVVSACVLAGVYGIFHDQFTYTISPEYYTKFKFYQFGMMDIGNEAIFPDPRFHVSLVGFFATWWMGIPIGALLGLVGLIHESWKEMARYVAHGFLITMVVAWIAGLSGLVYGFVMLAGQPKESFVNWYMPDNIIHLDDYIAVGSMHNMSYAGGVIGMILGGAYIISKRRQIRRERKFRFLWKNQDEQ